jgi:hypothetical protein
MNFERFPSSQFNSNESKPSAQQHFNQRNKSTMRTDSNQIEAANQNTGLTLEQQVKLS